MLSGKVVSILRHSNIPSQHVDKIIEVSECVFNFNIEDLEYIILFGSCSRNRANVFSDVDIMVVTTDTIDPNIRYEIRSKHCGVIDGVDSDIVFYTLDQLINGTTLFTEMVRKDGKILWKK